MRTAFSPQSRRLAILIVALVSKCGLAIELIDDRAITIHSAREVEERRSTLIQYLWGADGFPLNRMPDAVLTDVPSPVKQLTNLERVDEFHIEMTPGLQG